MLDELATYRPGRGEPQSAGPKPAISVVIPAYNHAEFLGQAIDSVLRQVFASFEIICVDDGSTDRTPEMLAELCAIDNRIRRYRLADRQGPGAARNFGLEQAHGDYVWFLDADDFLAPGSLSVLYRLACESGSEVVRGGLSAFTGGDMRTLFPESIPPDRRQFTFREERFLWRPWWHQAYLISRNFLRVNRINYPDLRDGEDPVFITRCLVRADSISTTPFVVYHYRKHDRPQRCNDHFQVHAEMVRALMIEYEPRIWFENYGPFVVDIAMPHQWQVEGATRDEIRAWCEQLDRLL